MNLQAKRVAIIGAGVAGLSAADELARWSIGVTLVERAPFVGGHAARLGCKATGECVTCGACLADERRMRVMRHANVSILTGTRVTGIDCADGFTLHYEKDAQRATGTSGSDGAGVLQADALLVATGFSAYDPSEKPYGYGRFPNVLTLLDAEGRLRQNGRLTRPSDERPPDRIAFIQCVGSRDSRIGHPWCSKICCGSALRMARLIQHQRPETSVTFFYIDVQTFGKNFQKFYDQTRAHIQMVRAIPGDIVQRADNCLQAAFFDDVQRKAREEEFDLVILSTGLTPAADNVNLAGMLDLPLAESGFFHPTESAHGCGKAGIFAAGAALGPMSIAESIDSAGKAAWEMLNYLRGTPNA
ncbi:MAG: FAD-dependent oxidoreductase [Desulfatitalea sp.]